MQVDGVQWGLLQCPQLQIVRCNFDKYRKAAHEVRKVLREFDPNFRSGGLDEATLEVSCHNAEIDILIMFSWLNIC